MTAHHNPHDEHLGEPGVDPSAIERPAEYSSPGLWVAGSLAAIGFIAAIYGYGQYQVTTAVKTFASQVETTGEATTPSPPRSTIGQGGAR